MDFLIDQMILDFGYDVGDQPRGAKIMDLIVILIISAYLYPLCIIKDFHRIKVTKKTPQIFLSLR